MSAIRKFSPGPEPRLRRGRSRSSSSSSSRSSSSSSSSSGSSGSADGHRMAAGGAMARMVAKQKGTRDKNQVPQVPGTENFPFGEFDANARIGDEAKLAEEGALVPRAVPTAGADDDMHQLSLTECGEEDHPGGQLEIKGLPHSWFFSEVLMLLRVNGVGRWAKILELGPDEEEDEVEAKHRQSGPGTQTAIIAYARAEDARRAAKVLDGQKPSDAGDAKPLECGWTTCKRDDEDLLGLKNEEVEPDDMGTLTTIDDRPKRKRAPEPEVMEAPPEPSVRDCEWTEPGIRGGWKCNLCGVFANSEQQVMIHLRGKKHQTRVRRHKEEESRRQREEEWLEQRRRAEEEFASIRKAELEAQAAGEAMFFTSELAAGIGAANRVQAATPLGGNVQMQGLGLAPSTTGYTTEEAGDQVEPDPKRPRLRVRVAGQVNAETGEKPAVHFPTQMQMGMGGMLQSMSGMGSMLGMMAGPNPSALERRVDPADGKYYTYQDFIVQYGPMDGHRRWDMSAPSSTHSPANAAIALMHQHALATGQFTPTQQAAPATPEVPVAPAAEVPQVPVANAADIQELTPGERGTFKPGPGAAPQPPLMEADA
eukprot:TRINITY_DN3700_c5_g1_i1.p1 TRINITY_DN3700_c5_g1~~TRINITY_DN3700_c5_g1_i1.p1  ORF type:complete len:594 (+),score=197.44 TRINITY_DN3700_c5_g1_i1:97-1878(+)